MMVDDHGTVQTLGVRDASETAFVARVGSLADRLRLVGAEADIPHVRNHPSNRASHPGGPV
jgi:hypothetical protein